MAARVLPPAIFSQPNGLNRRGPAIPRGRASAFEATKEAPKGSGRISAHGVLNKDTRRLRLGLDKQRQQANQTPSARNPRGAWHLDAPTFSRHASRIGVPDNSRGSAQRRPRKRAPRTAEFESAVMSPPMAIPRPTMGAVHSRGQRGGLSPLQGETHTRGVFRWRRGACHRLFSHSPPG